MDGDSEGKKELYFRLLGEHSERKERIREAVRKCLGDRISQIEEISVDLGSLSVERLAKVLHEFPVLLKPLSAVCNIAQRDFKLGAGIEVDTYAENLPQDKALLISAYLKGFLPTTVTLGALLVTDQWWYIDKEIRRTKGTGWEERIKIALTKASDLDFKKRKFREGDFEIDIAHPVKGPVQVAVDVKRIQSPRDIHKRSDEIINKAAHLKEVYPEAKFYAIIFYPFDDKTLLEKRFDGSSVDALFYAGESKESIDDAVDSLLKDAGIARRLVDASPKDLP